MEESSTWLRRLFQQHLECYKINCIRTQEQYQTRLDSNYLDNTKCSLRNTNKTWNALWVILILFIYLFIFISSFSGHRPVQRNVHQLFKDPEYWAGWGLNPRPPVRQTDALPTDLARPRSYILHTVKT